MEYRLGIGSYDVAYNNLTFFDNDELIPIPLYRCTLHCPPDDGKLYTLILRFQNLVLQRIDVIFIITEG